MGQKHSEKRNELQKTSKHKKKSRELGEILVVQGKELELKESSSL